MDTPRARPFRFILTICLGAIWMATTLTTAHADGPVGTQFQRPPGTHSTANDSSGNAGIVGDPITTSIGEYTFALPLLDLGGPLPIQFTLNYAASMLKTSGYYNDPFGDDVFSHSFHVGLKRWTNTDIYVLFGDGYGVWFNRPNASAPWKANGEEINHQLQETDRRYYLLDPVAELLYTFDKAMVGSEPVGVLTRVEDRRGNALTFTNDAAGRVTRVDDGLGRFLTFTYANPRDDWNYPHLVQVTDSFSRTIKFGYQTTSEPALTTHLTRVVDTLGATPVFTHTGSVTNTIVSAVMLPRGNTPYKNQYGTNQNLWQAASQTDAFGNTTQLKFEKENTTITDPLGTATQHTHADGKRLSALKDASGKTATFGYDANGRRNLITDRLGDATKFTYHAETGKLASVTNAQANTIAYTYTPQEQAIGETKFTFYNLTQVDYPDKTSEQFTYDAKGNVVAMVDSAGQTWKYTYNERGLPLTLTNPTNGVTTYAYNADLTLASMKDSDTGETRYGYDALKRVNKITAPDNSTVQVVYDAGDRITTRTDANNRATKFEYDANGNLVKLTDAAGQVSNLSYDEMDRLVKATNALGKSSTFTYDKLGRIASVADATGVKTEYAYDPRGWVNRITHGGDVWQIGYDDEGVPVAYTAPSGNVTKLQSDKLGALVGVTNALNSSATLQRDALGRVTRVTDALNRATQFSYDARGELSGVTEPEIGATKYDYDALGNLTKIADLNGGEWKFKYTAQGRLQTFTDPLAQATNLAYDPLGRLAKATYPDGTTYTPTYDAVGNLTRAHYSDGLDLQFKYDALDQLVEANSVKFTRDALGRITNAEQAGAGFGATYDDAGRIKTATYPGGLVVTYTYDSKTGLLTQVSDSLTKTQIDFTYDKDRRPIGIARSNKVHTTLTWDKAGRLVGVKDSNIVDAQYTLDAAGQVTGAKITAPLASTPVGQISNLSYDAASQISSNGYKYDARGRLTQSPANKFAWDGASRLIGVDATKLEYDAFGNVIARNDGKATTRYAYNFALGLEPLVAETNAAASVRYYVWTPGGKLLYAIDAADGNKVAHYHFDRIGSTLALTDANGTVTDAYAYDPFGAMVGHTGKSTQPFTFVGGWGVRQENAALYQMRARYYDATTQRFLSRDPIWPQIDDPQLLNPYAYAYNNPLEYVDVTGASPEPGASFFEGAGAAPQGLKIQHVSAETLASVRAQMAEINQQAIWSGMMRDLDARLAHLPPVEPKPLPEIKYQGKGFVRYYASKVGKTVVSGGTKLAKVLPAVSKFADPVYILVWGDVWTFQQWRELARRDREKKQEREYWKAYNEEIRALNKIQAAKYEAERLRDNLKVEAEREADNRLKRHEIGFLGGGRSGSVANQAEIDRQVRIMAAAQRLINFLGARETVRTKSPGTK